MGVNWWDIIARKLTHGQVGEKGLNFRCAHLGGMAHVMEGDIAFDPVDVGLLDTDGAVSPVA